MLLLISADYHFHVPMSPSWTSATSQSQCPSLWKISCLKRKQSQQQVVAHIAMAQDHYVDIYHSLLLSQVMRNQLYVGLLLASWGLDFLDDCISIFGAANLEFCETHTIAHFSCELPSLFPLACSNISTSLTALAWSYVICNRGTVLLSMPTLCLPL